jgi:hypothetical protein
VLIGICFTAYPQSQQIKTHQIMQVGDGLYHLFYDSSTAKSTIIEFDTFVALLEVPVKNLGGNATMLHDHVFGGKKVMASIEAYFPKKPLRYVLHSHWHPHSISSVRPFLEKGATLISTRSNFEKMKAFIDPSMIKRYERQIKFIEGDSVVIKDGSNEIVAYRFLQSEFPSTPTEEYLYFYFPKYAALHSGCMYNKWNGAAIDGRELYTDREQDLNKFIKSRALKVEKLIRINGDRHVADCMMEGKDFQKVVSDGITLQEITSQYFSMTTSILILKQDSIARNIFSRKIPPSVLNSNVYNSLKAKDLERALAFAKLQVMIIPSDPNAWDTLAEVTFFLGETELALMYGKHSALIQPTFSGGNIESWDKNLREHQRIWQAR